MYRLHNEVYNGHFPLCLSVLQELSGRRVVQLRRQQRGLGARGRSVHPGRLHPFLSET